MEGDRSYHAGTDVADTRATPGGDGRLWAPGTKVDGWLKMAEVSSWAGDSTQQ